jgi:hypothetical protein
MSIEQSFRDDKSGGFDLEHTRLQHAERVDRLLLATAFYFLPAFQATLSNLRLKPVIISQPSNTYV